MTELLKRVHDSLNEEEKAVCRDKAELAERSSRLFAGLIGAYTVVERNIKDHTGPFDELFRNGLAEHFKRAGAEVFAARELIDWMLYEFQLNAGRKAS